MVFVTGGTGFLGSYLIRLLIAKGEQVTALKRPTSDMRLTGDAVDKVRWIDGDLLDVVLLEEALRGIDKIYHCAGLVSLYHKDREKLMQINDTGTANLVNAALAAGVRRLLHVSSVVTLGPPATRNSLIDENCHWNENTGFSNYALTKFLAENQVWRGQAEGLSTVIVNPSTIIGAGKWKEGTAQVFDLISKGLKFYPAGSNGYVDVRDVARAMYLLMESGISNQRFIVSAENLSYREYFRKIASSLNVPPPSISLGEKTALWAAWLSGFAAFITNKKPVLTREIALLTHADLKFSNKKLLSALDIDLRPVDNTIDETVSLYRQSILNKSDFATLPLEDEVDLLPSGKVSTML